MLIRGVILKNYKIIVCLLLIRDYDVDVVINTINRIFSMSYPQTVYFINTMLEKKLIQNDFTSYGFSLTEDGQNYLKQFGLLDLDVNEINNRKPKINEEFYRNYFK